MMMKVMEPPYCIDLIEGAYLESDPEQCKAFRPAHAKPK